MGTKWTENPWLAKMFHVLHGEIRLSPRKACQVVKTCAFHHNICKERQIPIPYDDDDDDDDNESDDENDDDGDDAEGHLHARNGGAAHGNIISGTLYRQQFAETHF